MAQEKFGISYHNQKVDNVNVFYREAGDPEKPTILLMHGFPSSSVQFRELIPELPKAVVTYVDSGHFALESHHTEIAFLIKKFLRDNKIN